MTCSFEALGWAPQRASVFGNPAQIESAGLVSGSGLVAQSQALVAQYYS